jgi:hypothetical protein
MREAIDKRIRAVLPGDKGAIAAALITGKRDTIFDASERSHVRVGARPRALDLRLAYPRFPQGGRRSLHNPCNSAITRA